MNYTVAQGRVYFDPLSMAQDGMCRVALSRDSWPDGSVGRFGADFSMDSGITWEECTAADLYGGIATFKGQEITESALEFSVSAGMTIRPWLELTQDISTMVTAE